MGQNLDRDVLPIFLVLKISKILFFRLSYFCDIFGGLCKISTIFLGRTKFELLFGSFSFCIYANFFRNEAETTHH